ncbi:MAG: DUF2240 family protein [Halobacteriales archaeon]
MELRRVLAVAFKHRGRRRLEASGFVTALAIDRDWFTPEEVRRLIERGREAGVIEDDGDGYVPAFDLGEVAIPTGYEPPADLLRSQPPFERVLAALEAAGHDRRDSVAAINELQERLGTDSDAAAVAYAHGEGLDVADLARTVRRSIEEGAGT